MLIALSPHHQHRSLPTAVDAVAVTRTPPDGFEPSTDCLEGREKASHSSAFSSDTKGLSA